MGIILCSKFIDNLINKITEKGSIRDLYKIAKLHDIEILETNLGKGGGLYFYHDRSKTILLNCNLSHYHKLIVLAHEIAHAFLHPYEEAHFTIMGYRKDKKENEANYFACKLLDVIGYWDNEDLCVYEYEMSKSDIGFITTYKNYRKEYSNVN